MNDEGIDFRAFAEGVATSRVSAALGPGHAFSCEKTFGKLDLNALLLQVLNESVNPLAKNLLKSARARQEEGGESPADPDADESQASGVVTQSPPILRVYIDQRIRPKDEGGDEK